MKENRTGRVTLPVEENCDDILIQLMELWGADAIRNSDGTRLPKTLADRAEKVYETYFPVRQDLEWAQAHPQSLQEMYLLSEPKAAKDEKLAIHLLDGIFDQQLKVDVEHDPKQWWEVIDRTSGETVPPECWDYTADGVIIKDCEKWHIYTVAFLVWQIWDPTQMFNHITNDWGKSVPHSLPYNPAKPEVRERMLAYFRQWLKDNPTPNVIRFTTFFYHFCLFFNDRKKEKFVDWFGYGQSVSPELLEAFAQEKGYRLHPEDLVDQGYYNNAFRVPTLRYLEYMDFVQRFVAKTAKEVVDVCHEHGREAMMFLGDNYIGTEPYGKHFASIGLDAVVGSVGSGCTMRMIADIPGVRYTEGRFLPYFFPTVFHEGGDPVGKVNQNWLQARRAMLRNPVDRIGYGGYPSLALKFPDFITRVGEICDEFRTMYDNIAKSRPYSLLPGKVAILNCWGDLRTWQTHMVAHAMIFKQTASYIGVLEALSGMAVDVAFLSFDDIRGGVPEGISVIINAGEEGTAFSGGKAWADPKVVVALREWVHGGGGFIGVGEPTALRREGHFFQLFDVLGVDKEISLTLNYTKYNPEAAPHFITDDLDTEAELGDCCDDVYAHGAQNLIVAYGCTRAAAHDFGKGRSVYLAGLPYSAQNTRLLLRALCWAAHSEDSLKHWFSINPATECSYYPATGRYAVVNNTMEPQTTTVFKGDASCFETELAPMELKWYKIEERT
ncbi:1,3-beta-galactosyl-N-acetylhexosamine phosphorylase [Muricomes intestini]|uniref:1,3-beta-galactosyl-N-acetylhexosamine phosphorylase n=1 Tax=Muricomes intestini TaxID=1796634 RepID=UPI002FE3E99A